MNYCQLCSRIYNKIYTTAKSLLVINLHLILKFMKISLWCEWLDKFRSVINLMSGTFSFYMHSSPEVFWELNWKSCELRKVSRICFWYAAVKNLDGLQYSQGMTTRPRYTVTIPHFKTTYQRHRSWKQFCPATILASIYPRNILGHFIGCLNAHNGWRLRYSIDIRYDVESPDRTGLSKTTKGGFT